MPRVSIMDKIRQMFGGKKDAGNGPDYEPVSDERMPLALEDDRHSGYASSLMEGELEDDGGGAAPFSWVEYSIFVLIGVAMLWAWNMFMAAAPYFQMRFAADPAIRDMFQSTIISVSTCANLAAMLILTNIQYSASYPFRINTALVMNVVVFGLLTASTSVFLHVASGVYLLFLVVMVAGSAWACGLIQNGAFAFAASFGRPEYTQAIMAGQGVAGVLPPLAQMVTVLVFPPPLPPPPPGPAAVHLRSAEAEAGTSAFYYFLTAVVISVVALVAFQPLARRHDRIVETRMAQALSESMASIEDAERAARKVVGLKTLFFKMHWVALSVFICFVITMFFPVFTPKVLSVRTVLGDPATGGGAAASVPAILRPPAFIPLAFFFWNLGDLLGRITTMLPVPEVLQRRPVLLFAFGLARLVFLPLYFLCNLGGRGAVVNSDLFYLLLVQLPFGLSSGWLSSTAMMTAGEWVEDGEREAAGGFMGLCLVAGLTVGSFLSFTVASI
ncbi:hypothetical protein HMPREF1624_00155 [Sporothrix schenckii ATCC 58251]|uniref:Nucleoside transporter n=1 Tax=Sporothrix schenckii (strain ATCC 58251 / de Perez 2211183) TaxID=1391915 RepID=U7Q567_SPOS1|nr:hypothetical protein HMPREF1624_00155 [Sporothrix schenckii ATCC 58251]